MARKMSFAGKIGRSMSSKATNYGKRTIHMALFGEDAPKGKKKTK